jgi:hypothetical protein
LGLRRGGQREKRAGEKEESGFHDLMAILLGNDVVRVHQQNA